MKRIAIFQTNLKVGGIQRSLVSLLRLLDGRDDIRVDVFINDDRDIFFSPPESENIRIFFIGMLPYFVRFIPFDLAFRLFEKRIAGSMVEALGSPLPGYSAAIDFDSYQMSTAIGALAVDSARRICWVHNDVLLKYRSEWKYRVLHFFFRRKYEMFDKMAMVSKGIVPAFYKLNPDAPPENVIVNNPIDVENIRRSLLEKGDLASDALPEKELYPSRIEIVSMGRLMLQKGYEDMLRHIKKIALKRTPEEIHFTIIGDGPDRAKLLHASREISAYVTFTGYLKNPFKLMNRADAYLSCSKYEGQPLTLLEARALNLPVIMPRSLEQYTDGMIEGCDDVEAALLSVKKRKEDERRLDFLSGYNERVRESFDSVTG